MFKKIIYLIIFLLCISYTVSFAATNLTKITYDGTEHVYDVRDVTLMLNNDKFEPKEGQMPPIILNERTLVPVREVFEYLGGTVDWINSERRVDICFDDTKISLWIDNYKATVNGKSIDLDVPAKIINDKTMVPVRFISEKANLLVGWDQETYTVDIKYQKANITNISFSNINGTNCMVVKADNKITGYKYFSLPKDENNDFRLVLDVENCKFVFDTTNAKFDSGMVSAIRFGNQGNDTNRIVIDLRNETDYVVAMSKDRKTLYYAMAEEFNIPGEEKETTDSNSNQQEDNTPEIKNNDNLNEEIKQSENIVVANSGDNKNEIIAEKSGENKSDVINGSGEKSVKENQASNEENSNEKDVQSSGEEKNNNSISENIIVDADNPDSLDDIKPFNEHDYEDVDDEEIEYETIIESIKYSTVSERIKIKYSGSISYDDMTLTNPNRIVIDIPDAKLDVSGPTEINIKNSVITSVRFSQYTKASVRIVIDLSTRGEYNIYKRSSELQVEVKESTYKNIKYKKNTSNSQITLQKVKISNLIFDQDEKKFRYTVKYNKDCDFGIGGLNPDDDFVKSISVEDGVITIIDSGNCTYAVRQSSENVVITIRKAVKESAKNNNSFDEEDTSGKKIILIDVGHGGSDPGACNGSAQEKTYNLNIALYLYEMLKERDDIIVFIDREDNDTYLNREDRVAFATNVNPHFIISIHNNSLENKSYSGTMVLYYNNETESDFGDVTSKECADIVLKELVSKLDTINRGDLHILSKTPCPSILCEVCFISNDAELERLKTKSFQKSAAEAMYNGIDKILKAM